MVALSAVDLVYVQAPDRLARSYAHQVLLLEEFARAEARVVFLNRPIGEKLFRDASEAGQGSSRHAVLGSALTRS